MFEELFKNFIDDGIITKTEKYYVRFGRQANNIYKVKHGYKRAIQEVLKELGFELSRNKEYKLDIILYKDMFIGCIE